ncbi:MAG: RDD family protein [Verrucomicrobiota bacterium]|nr:RDD family protein [Verrucomicrobiota bacterium]
MKHAQKTLTVRTPEGISFPLPIATPISRFLALAVDLAVIYGAMTMLTVVLALFGLISTDLAGAFWLLASFLLALGYPIVMEWFWRGQTLGKRLLRLQVMDEQGLRLQFSQIVIRNLLRAVDGLPLFYLFGGVSAFLSMRGQRLGDLAANTIVVFHPKIPELDFDEIRPAKYNSFRDHPHLVARLRQGVTPAETGIILQALLRRDRIAPEARPALFVRLRAHLERKVRFPPEVVEGLSDEQYVRNALDALLK